MRRGYVSFVLFLIVWMVTADAEPLTIAVASNFATAASEIGARYTEQTGDGLRMTRASTGVLYAQIVNGAPFDILLAADSERPALLEAAGVGVPGTRFTYATGSLVLWSRDPKLEGADCRAHLENLGPDRLAIANPRTAPYGAAAREFLRSQGLWEKVMPRLVFGENIAQTLQFVATGNATLGLIARSQLLDPRLPPGTCRWAVPGSLHAPLEQQAILLGRAVEDARARRFLEFLRGREAIELLRRHGYLVAP